MATVESPSETITGGELFVKQLLSAKIERLYCVPGESFLAVIDALYDVQDRVKQITCRHESGAAIMASADAQLRGKPAVCFVTRGPGATNASIALHIAQQASIPLILCIGQVARGNLGREAFQEIDYQAFFGSIAKRVFTVNDPSKIPEVFSQAYALSAGGRAGPVVLVFPEDVLSSRCLQTNVTNRLENSQVESRGFAAEDLAAVTQRLAAARRPVVIVGGTQWNDRCCAKLGQFVAKNELPVFAAFRRNDILDNHHSSYCGYLGLNQHVGVADLIRDSDCTLVLGARLDEPTTSDYRLFDADNQVIHIYPNRPVPDPKFSPALLITANMADVISALSESNRITANDVAPWRVSCRDAYIASCNDALADKFDPKLVDLPKLMTEFNHLIPDDAIITTDAGNFTVWPQRLRQYRRPGRLLAPINGAMGYGVPAAIGASLTYPERIVVGFVGDGGMMMTGMELATGQKYGAKPIILVFNNAKFGTIEMHQSRQYPGREHGNDLFNPDFVRFAESFGVAATRVRTHFDFAEALLQAKQLGEMSLIEIQMYA